MKKKKKESYILYLLLDVVTVVHIFQEQERYIFLYKQKHRMLFAFNKEKAVTWSIHHFFNLEKIQHKTLFTSCTHVWEVLQHLTEYCKGLPLGNIEVPIPEGVTLVHKERISIGIGTTIEPGSFIQGPCYIGKNCQIRQGAYIRGDVIVEDGAIVGHTTEVKHSILLSKAYAAHFAYVGDSILGNNINLGAGVKCANLRLDGHEVFVKSNGEKIATGMRKFGSIIGDTSQIGCNCVLNPGTIIGKGVLVHPGLVLGGVIADKSTVRTEQKIQIV